MNRKVKYVLVFRWPDECFAYFIQFRIDRILRMAETANHPNLSHSIDIFIITFKILRLIFNEWLYVRAH